MQDKQENMPEKQLAMLPLGALAPRSRGFFKLAHPQGEGHNP